VVDISETGKGDRLNNEQGKPELWQPGPSSHQLQNADMQENVCQQDQCICDDHRRVSGYPGKREHGSPKGACGERTSYPAKPLKKRIAKTDNQKPPAPAAKKDRADNQNDVSFHSGTSNSQKQLKTNTYCLRASLLERISYRPTPLGADKSGFFLTEKPRDSRWLPGTPIENPLWRQTKLISILCEAQ
jgi:hypothetical protein